MYTAYRVITYMEAYESIYYGELFSSDNRKQLSGSLKSLRYFCQHT